MISSLYDFPVIPEEDDESPDYPSHPKRTHCKYCNEPVLGWHRVHITSYILLDLNKKPHKCKPKEISLGSSL